MKIKEKVILLIEFSILHIGFDHIVALLKAINKSDLYVFELFKKFCEGGWASFDMFNIMYENLNYNERMRRLCCENVSFISEEKLPQLYKTKVIAIMHT